jgi:hypothetical protein
MKDTVKTSRAALRVPWICGAVAAATIAVGYVLDRRGTILGVPQPPFVGAWDPRAHWLLAPALGAFAAAIALVPRALRLPPARFAAALFGAALTLLLALAAARGGPGAWDHVFVAGTQEAGNEYLPALPAFTYGAHYFLDDFAQLVPALPVHAAGHPPGLLLTMHFLGLTTPARLAGLCIAAAALSAPLAYALGRRVAGERDARIAGLLTVFAPGVLLFGATSADAIYLALGLCAAIALLDRPLLGAVVLTAASLFAWSLLAVGAWVAILVLLRAGPRAAARLALIVGATLLAGHAAFALATGFDPLGTLRATGRVYALGVASRRPYEFWLLGSPVAFLVMLGIPIAALATRSAAQRRPEALAIAAIIAIAAVAGFTKAETERIWLFLAPFVCLAAAPLVRRPRALAGVLAVQALAYGLLFDTIW